MSAFLEGLEPEPQDYIPGSILWEDDWFYTDRNIEDLAKIIAEEGPLPYAWGGVGPRKFASGEITFKDVDGKYAALITGGKVTHPTTVTAIYDHDGKIYTLNTGKVLADGDTLSVSGSWTITDD